MAGNLEKTEQHIGAHGRQTSQTLARPKSVGQTHDRYSVRRGRNREPTPEEQGKDPAAVKRGKLGGVKGGKARAAALTPEQRSEAAKRAVSARWRKQS
jgi:hypothetical protein